MRPAPSQIWHDAAARIAGKKEGVEITGQQKKVLDYLWDNFSGLYLGLPGQVHSKETILLISQDLSKNVSTVVKRERFDFLARGFDRGNKSIAGWHVPLGPVYVKVNREVNFSRQEWFRHIGQAEKFIEVFRESMEIPNIIDKEALLGQLLLSAIFFGGLLDRRWLHPFLISIQMGHYYQEGPVFWVDMVEKKKNATASPGDSIDEDNASVQLVRRLVPDYLTRLLIYRYHRLGDISNQCSLSHDPWRCALTYVKFAGFDASVVPQSLTKLLSWAFARYLTILPHSLVAYSCGKLETFSLPTSAWLRTITGMAIPVTKPATGGQAGQIGARPRIVDNERTQKSEQQPLLSELLKSLRFNKKSSNRGRGKPAASESDGGRVMRQKARRIINVFMRNNKSRMNTTMQLLLHWALRLLDEKISYLERRQKQAIIPASIDRYLSAIGYALLYVGGDLSLHRLEPQELETVYEQVAQRLKQDRYAMNRLRQFHGFLQFFYEVEEMEWSGLLGEDGSPRSVVSANFISTEVYRAVLESLGWGRPELSRWQRLHIISLILLYRCGLRPSEAQALRLKDVQGITRYELLIRNSRLNSIKTNSGIRRIPLSRMLLGDELGFFLDYYKMRLEEDKQLGGGLLLSHPVHFKSLLKDDELFEPLRKLLRSITKDETIRLYHLRHTMLTRINTIIQLTDRYEIEFPEIMPPPEEIKLAQDLFDYLYGNEDMGRKGQYLLAMLAGHASPETTNYHYCHLLDLVLSHHLNSPANAIEISKDIVMQLTGLQRSTVYELMTLPEEIHSLHNTVANESRKYKDELRHPLIQSALTMKAKFSKESNITLPPWEEAISVLKDHTKLNLLRRDKIEWNFAALMYEIVRGFDGRKIKTVRKVVKYISENYSDRYGGINIHLESKAKLIASFVKEKKMPKSYITIIYHHAKNLSDIEVNEMRKNWSVLFGISQKLVINGENIPAKMKLKSMVTIKITLNKKEAKKIRAPKMSPGFLTTIEMFNKILNG